MRSTLQLVALSFFSAVFGALFVQWLAPSSIERESVQTTPVRLAAHQSMSPSPTAAVHGSIANHPLALPDFRTAAGMAVDAVVHVRTAQAVSTANGWSSWYDFFQSPSERQMITGSGSGVILDSDGFIVTNHHVIEGADAIEIVLNDNRSFAAELIGSDPTTDIAVLKVDAQGISAIDWGDSDELRVGDWVLAVGNPFDLVSTVTAGIVSAKARDIQLLRPDFDRSLFPIESFIQTDAAVNPGNSGGALVDTQGRLVGINTAIASRTGSYTGYAFAVPANLAKKVARDLIEFGAVQRAYLGVSIRPVDEAIATSMELPSVSGVLVSEVTENSGARAAGISAGDVIMAVEGTPTTTLPQLLEKINQFRPGQTVSVEVWRAGNLMGFDVELGTREGLARTSALANPVSEARNGGTANAAEETMLLGCLIRSIPGKGGVEILDVGDGPFAGCSIAPGTRIVAANGALVADASDLRSVIDEAQKAGNRGILLEGINATGETEWCGLDLRG